MNTKTPVYEQSEFETEYKHLPGEWKLSVRNVADSMEMARLWFEDREAVFSAADLIDVAKMIMAERERKILEERQREV